MTQNNTSSRGNSPQSIPNTNRENGKVNGDFYALQKHELLALKKAKLINNSGFVHLALRLENPYCDRDIEIIPKEFAARWDIPQSSVYEALGKLEEVGLIPDWVHFNKIEKDNPEERVRNRLQLQLGGLTEVTTPAGRIDLLTAKQVIEVKRIEDWKAALGQILVYSGFYPEHEKRLHLFGKESQRKLVIDIQASCIQFRVKVTFEVEG